MKSSIFIFIVVPFLALFAAAYNLHLQHRQDWITISAFPLSAHDIEDDNIVDQQFQAGAWFDPRWNAASPNDWIVGKRQYEVRDLMGRGL
jgi:hypothetical protein